MDKIIKELGIDETYTKVAKKQKVFNKVSNNVPPIAHYNYMADLLHLPTTSKNNKYLLVVVDLANNDFDFQEMTNNTSETTLKAFQDMFKRKYIKKPYASVRTDGGAEFKGDFDKWLKENNILHKTAVAGRHKQLANVESLNRQLGRLLVGYMNKIEVKTGKIFKDWDDPKVLSHIRTKLNAYRDKKLKSMEYYAEQAFKNPPNYELAGKPKYKVGDVVHYKLDHPESVLGHKQDTSNFREGDVRWNVKEPRKIVKVIYMNDPPYYRYMLQGLKNVSFNDTELMPSKETDNKYKVKKIIGMKKIKGVVNYLVWWEKYKKAEATYEPAKNLIEDGFEEEIKAFNNKK